MTLGQKFVRITRRTAEQSVELLVGHPQTCAVIEIRLFEAEAAVLLKIEKTVEDQVLECGLAVGRQAHDLVLARIYLEANVIGERGIQQTQRVRKMDFLNYLKIITFAN